MRKLYYFLVTCCYLLLLCQCAVQPARLGAANQKIAWQARQQKLSQINQWDIKGAIALKQAKKGINAYFQWQQQTHKKYQLRLYGPLASGQIKLSGSKRSVTMTDSDNNQFRAHNAERLLAQQTGWLVPVDSLFYWIRGIPAPKQKFSKQLDSYQHLSLLKQQGWTIHYQRYTAVNGVDLPSKIQLENQQFRIRIVIREWSLHRT